MKTSFEGFTPEQAEELSKIVEAYIEDLDRHLVELRDNNDWLQQLKEYLGAYFMVLRAVEFAAINPRTIILKAMIEPMLEEIMTFTTRFLGSQYIDNRDKKAAEELRKMVGE